MKITYINHSGFLIETADCYYLFDYYKGELPPLDIHKPILVFASHMHPDHYNPSIFGMLHDLKMKQITAVLSKDIPGKKYPFDIEILTVTFHQCYELPYNGGQLYTLHSTDRGVAFVVKCGEGIFYHAGDLNDWVWEGMTERNNKQMTGSFRHEIKVLQEYLGDKTVDMALLPLDPRQEKHYHLGMLYFLQKIPTKKAFPMHYWEKPEVIHQFVQEYPAYKNIVQNTENMHLIV
uniref:MBL fold metallo-hydrolase n=1 Tax=Acetatifactor sp. TaxID=1872090 RepID=UPI0040562664